MNKNEVMEFVKEYMEYVRNTHGMFTISTISILDMLNKIYSKIVMMDDTKLKDDKITYFKKSIDDMDVHSLALILCKSRCCPFPNLLCYDCEFFKEEKRDDYNGHCHFPDNVEEVIKLLESEVEE